MWRFRRELGPGSCLGGPGAPQVGLLTNFGPEAPMLVRIQALRANLRLKLRPRSGVQADQVARVWESRASPELKRRPGVAMAADGMAISAAACHLAGGRRRRCRRGDGGGLACSLSATASADASVASEPAQPTTPSRSRGRPACMLRRRRRPMPTPPARGCPDWCSCHRQPRPIGLGCILARRGGRGPAPGSVVGALGLRRATSGGHWLPPSWPRWRPSPVAGGCPRNAPSHTQPEFVGGGGWQISRSAGSDFPRFGAAPTSRPSFQPGSSASPARGMGARQTQSLGLRFRSRHPHAPDPDVKRSWASPPFPQGQAPPETDPRLHVVAADGTPLPERCTWAELLEE